MTSADLVSVVVPVGAVDQALADQLRALVDQRTERPFEVVLARNTADPDATRSLDMLVQDVSDPRVRVVAADSRRSASHARNQGAAASRGEVLVFCDADDLVHPGWLDALVAGLDHDDAVGGHLVDVGSDGGPANLRPPATPGSLPTFLGIPYVVSASLAIRRRDLQAVDGFDEELVRCEDIALSWALLSHGRSLGYVSDAVVEYRHRPGLVPLVRQHYLYGQGMSQVLVRYEMPATEATTDPGWRRLVRANGQPGGSGSWIGILRRGSVAAGRLVGLAREAWTRVSSRS